MAWTAGQQVAQWHGQFTRRVLKGTVATVTPSGRASVRLERADGGFFVRAFSAEGRPIPRSSGAQYLKAWEPEEETQWQKQKAEHAKRAADTQEAREQQAREIVSDNAALDHALNYLAHDHTALAARARTLIEQIKRAAP